MGVALVTNVVGGGTSDPDFDEDFPQDPQPLSPKEDTYSNPESPKQISWDDDANRSADGSAPPGASAGPGSPRDMLDAGLSTSSPSIRHGPKPNSIRQAVNRVKQADRQWADRAISLLPLQEIDKQPLRLQTKEWHHPDVEAAMTQALEAELAAADPSPTAMSSSVGHTAHKKKVSARSSAH